MPSNETNPGIKRGRPTYEPSPEDRARVSNMHSIGLRETDISTILRISPKTLRKHFRQELATAHLFANTEVLTTLYKEAVSVTCPQSSPTQLYEIAAAL